MSSIEIRFISKDDMDTLDIGLQEAIDAVELGFKAWRKEGDYALKESLVV
jgi:pyruvate kinase